MDAARATLSARPRPSTASSSRPQSALGRPASAAAPRQPPPTSADPYTSEFTGTPALPAELLLLEELGASAEMKEAVVEMLKRRPDDPMLFLAAYFSDKMSCNGSLAAAYGHICAPHATETEFMDAAACAFLALEEGRGGSGAGVGVPLLEQLVKKLIGPGWPRTEQCTLRAVRGRDDGEVPFRDFHLAMRVCLLVKRLQRLALSTAGQSSGSAPPGSQMITTDVCGDVVERICKARPQLVGALSSIHAGAGAADEDGGGTRWSVDADSFVHDLMAALYAGSSLKTGEKPSPAKHGSVAAARAALHVVRRPIMEPI
eukprot:jgi/Tetstr1/437645/TSEL_026312.t1